MDILLLVGGLLLILIGANGLTDGAASVAKRFRIPSIVIGLTIVAFGTSAPELAVSVSSALKGSADIAIGNVVGSNIINSRLYRIIRPDRYYPEYIKERNSPLYTFIHRIADLCQRYIAEPCHRKCHQHHRRIVVTVFFRHFYGIHVRHCIGQ